MFDQIINGFFWLNTVFTKSRDPFLEDFRQRQRLIVVSAVVALGAMFLAVFVAPTSLATGYNTLVVPLQTMVARIFVTVNGVAALYFIWASYRLWKLFDDCR